MRKLRLFRRKFGQKDAAEMQLEEEISHTQQTEEWTAPQPGEEDHTQPAEEWMARRNLCGRSHSAGSGACNRQG